MQLGYWKGEIHKFILCISVSNDKTFLTKNNSEQNLAVHVFKGHIGNIYDLH